MVQGSLRALSMNLDPLSRGCYTLKPGNVSPLKWGAWHFPTLSHEPAPCPPSWLLPTDAVGSWAGGGEASSGQPAVLIRFSKTGVVLPPRLLSKESPGRRGDEGLQSCPPVSAVLASEPLLPHTPVVAAPTVRHVRWQKMGHHQLHSWPWGASHMVPEAQCLVTGEESQSAVPGISDPRSGPGSIGGQMCISPKLQRGAPRGPGSTAPAHLTPANRSGSAEARGGGSGPSADSARTLAHPAPHKSLSPEPIPSTNWSPVPEDQAAVQPVPVCSMARRPVRAHSQGP